METPLSHKARPLQLASQNTLLRHEEGQPGVVRESAEFEQDHRSPQDRTQFLDFPEAERENSNQSDRHMRKYC